MGSKYIVDVTKTLQVAQESKEMFELLSQGLAKVKARDPQIIELGVIGGAALDLLLGIQPKDIDIRYSYMIDGQLTTDCCCDHIRSLIQEEFDPKLLAYDIDLENILEMEPYLDLKEKHLGLLSQHTDYISMFMLDSEGRMWGNKDSIKCFQEGVFEARFEGLLVWVAFRDVNNYYRIFCGTVTRGLSYLNRRHMKMGEKFKLALEYLPFALEQLLGLPEQRVSYRKLFNSKIGSIDNLRKILIANEINDAEKVCSLVERVISIS